MNRKSIFIIISVAVVILQFFGCGKDSSTGKNKKGMKYHWPVVGGGFITGAYGKSGTKITKNGSILLKDKKTFFRKGILIGWKLNSKVRSPADGKIIKIVDRYRHYGKAVIIEHANGHKTVFGNIDSLKVKIGDTIKAKQIFAQIGKELKIKSKGEVKVLYVLYVELRKNNRPIDVLRYIGKKVKSLE